MNGSYYIPIEQLPGYQTLTGGVPCGTVTGFLGAPQAGKTALCFQLGVEVCNTQAGNFMVFDTENKFHQHLELVRMLSERFEKPLNLVRVKASVKVVTKKDSKGKEERRYDAKWEMEDEVDPDAINIFTVHTPDIKPITIMHGRGVELEIYDSGKFKVKMIPDAWAPEIEDSLLAKFIEKHNVKCLLYDSITNPLDEIPAVGENFPARADLTQVWLLQIHKLAAHYNLPILATVHESKNETGLFSKDLKLEGGKAVGYNLGFVVYCLLRNEKGLLPGSAAKPHTLASDERAIFLARHPGRKPWAEIRYLTLTDSGLYDVQH